MVNRILRDDPSKSDMHNREGITLGLMWKAFKDYDMWPIYVLGLTFGIPAGPPDQYLTLTLRRLGFDTFETNLLSIPAQVLTTASVSASLVYINSNSLTVADPTLLLTVCTDDDHDLRERKNQSTSLLRSLLTSLDASMRGRASCAANLER